MTSSDIQPQPPDEWLALSDAERAELLRRIRQTVSIPHQAPPDEPQNTLPTASPGAIDHPGIDKLFEIAMSLTPDDCTILIADLWDSLPQKNRAAIVRYTVENVSHPSTLRNLRQNSLAAEKTGPTIWDRLFDPASTSELYSAPRRFDLATIFVVTAAYSILFGAMSAFSDFFSPVFQAATGALVTVVAVTQAFYKDVANPRGVSIVTGSIAQSVILIVFGMAAPRSFPEPMVLVIVFGGIIGGAITGYLAGVLVGGVFLVADELRKWHDRRLQQRNAANAAADPTENTRSESPWEN